MRSLSRRSRVKSRRSRVKSRRSRVKSRRSRVKSRRSRVKSRRSRLRRLRRLASTPESRRQTIIESLEKVILDGSEKHELHKKEVITKNRSKKWVEEDRVVDISRDQIDQIIDQSSLRKDAEQRKPTLEYFQRFKRGLDEKQRERLTYVIKKLEKVQNLPVPSMETLAKVDPELAAYLNS